MNIKKFFFIFFHKLGFVFVIFFLWLSIKGFKRKYINFESDSETMSLEERYESIYKAASKAVFCANAKVKVKGFKNIPKKAALFVCNHKSNFDVLVFLKAFWKNSKDFSVLPPAFVAKKELENDKNVYYAAKLINTVFIDRNNIRDIPKVIQKEKEIIESNKQSMTVFIEGTRIKEDKFGEFKATALEPAYKTYCPIVPVVIYGTIGVEKENRKQMMKYKEITVEFLEPIKYKDFIHLNKEIVAQKLKESMEKKYFELKQNPYWKEEQE